MTKRIGNTVVICPGPPDTCELCGKVDELRPYGPNGESICFECGMKDESGTNERMKKMLFGEVDS